MYLLKFTNQYDERFYFVSASLHHNGLKLIDATTPEKSKARPFETAPEAAMVLKEAGNPADWEIVAA